MNNWLYTYTLEGKCYDADRTEYERCGGYIYHVGNLKHSNGMIMSYGENIYFNHVY